MDKTYVFEGAGGGDSSMMSGLMSGLLGKNNLDPNLVAALMNNRNQDGMGGNMSFIWIILLFFLFGRKGLGESDVPAQLNNDSGRELLMNAIQGNGTAIGQIAATLNTSTAALQSAICGVNNTLTQLGGQVGMSAQQIINAVQSGNCQLSGLLSNGFCDVKNAITVQGYEGRLAECNQTNTLVTTMNNNNQAVIARIDAFEHSQLQNRIEALRERNSELQTEVSQRNQNEFIAATLAPISARLAAIECHQLPTYPQTFIPGVPVAAYPGPVGFGYGCGCNPCDGGRNW